MGPGLGGSKKKDPSLGGLCLVGQAGRQADPIGGWLRVPPLGAVKKKKPDLTPFFSSLTITASPTPGEEGKKGPRGILAIPTVPVSKESKAETTGLQRFWSGAKSSGASCWAGKWLVWGREWWHLHPNDRIFYDIGPPNFILVNLSQGKKNLK